ncbi:MAG: hypothetical protein PHN20_08180, partial [Bacteroidales bacterium]|nr:hypothetical protein [Bacteroidales bacterium]
TIAKPEPEEKKAPGFLNKIKTLVVEHEFVLSEKDIEESLFEHNPILNARLSTKPIYQSIISCPTVCFAFPRQKANATSKRPATVRITQFI